MSMTDPIADMLTRIRNAIQAGHRRVEIPASNQKRAMAQLLEKQGYIDKFEEIDNNAQGTLRLFLKYYENREPIIGGLKRVSKPGRRFYTKCDRIPQTLGGLGVNILSTSKGIMTDKEARKRGLGGEVLCSVW